MLESNPTRSNRYLILRSTQTSFLIIIITQLSWQKQYYFSLGRIGNLHGMGGDESNHFSYKIIMINPFISNNDSNYLFRKNYQFLARQEQPSPLQNYSASKLNLLQSKNPFKPNIAPNIASASTARSLSNSRVGMNSPQAKLMVGKNRLLDEADGWKKELESQERERLSAYGAEGLRYNAYPTFPQKSNNYDPEYSETNRLTARYEVKKVEVEPQYNDYYTVNTKPLEVKTTRVNRDSGNQPQFHSKVNRNDSLTYPANPINPNKRVRQHFTDEINESELVVRPNEGTKRQRNRYDMQMSPIHEQSRQSNLDDMFGSAIDDRFKQSMHHHSYASYNYNVDELVQSKRSKFVRESPPQQRASYLEQSAVKHFEMVGPPTIYLLGKTYYRTDL